MKTKKQKYISLVIIVLLLLQATITNSQHKEKVWQWINRVGGPGWDYVNGMQTDTEGNIYIGGAYSGDLIGKRKLADSNGKQDLFVAKYTQKGKLKWLWDAGGTQADKLTAMYITANNELIIGGIITGEAEVGKEKLEGENKKLILCKLNSDGKLQWIKKIPIEHPASMYQIYHSQTAGIFVAGTFKKTFTIDNKKIKSKGKEDIFLAYFTGSGELKELKSFGSKAKDVITSLAGIDNGKIYMAISYQGELVLDDNKLDVPANKTGSVIMVLNHQLGLNEFYEFGNTSYIELTALAPTVNGDLYVSGNFTHSFQYKEHELASKGAMDFFAAKLDTLGKPLWIKSYGSPYTDYANHILLNPVGGIMLNGTFNDTLVLDTMQLSALKGKATAFVSQINPQGTVIWAESIGGKNNVSSNHSTLDKQGNIFLSGSFKNNIKNERFNLKSQGEEDIFIAKYHNCPDHPNVIKGETYICKYGETELKIEGKYENISWNNGLSTDKKITISEPGTYFVEMTDAYACLVRDTIEINLKPGPLFNLGNDTILFTDQSITLQGPEGMESYLWHNNYTMPVQYISSQGEYNHQIDVWLNVVDSLNCEYTDSLLVKFEVRTPFIDIKEAHDLVVYPNPVYDFIKWSLICERKTSLRVELTSIEGQIVYSEEVYNYLSGQTKKIPVHDLPAGSYYLGIGNKKEKLTTTVVIINE